MNTETPLAESFMTTAFVTVAPVESFTLWIDGVSENVPEMCRKSPRVSSSVPDPPSMVPVTPPSPVSTKASRPAPPCRFSTPVKLMTSTGITTSWTPPAPRLLRTQRTARSGPTSVSLPAPPLKVTGIAARTTD